MEGEASVWSTSRLGYAIDAPLLRRPRLRLRFDLFQCRSKGRQLRDQRLARWRADHVGIVFQNFHLIPTLTAAENVALALRFSGRRRGRKALVEAALDAVGLRAKSRRLPSQLSGGEQQRVGVARAIVHRPPMILADEPTGSLDTASGREVFALLRAAADAGTTVVFITHDPALAAEADRVVHMLDGRIVGVDTKDAD